MFHVLMHCALEHYFAEWMNVTAEWVTCCCCSAEYTKLKIVSIDVHCEIRHYCSLGTIAKRWTSDKLVED